MPSSGKYPANTALIIHLALGAQAKQKLITFVECSVNRRDLSAIENVHRTSHVFVFCTPLIDLTSFVIQHCINCTPHLLKLCRTKIKGFSPKYKKIYCLYINHYNNVHRTYKYPTKNYQLFRRQNSEKIYLPLISNSAD